MSDQLQSGRFLCSSSGRGARTRDRVPWQDCQDLWQLCHQQSGPGHGAAAGHQEPDATLGAAWKRIHLQGYLVYAISGGALEVLAVGVEGAIAGQSATHSDNGEWLLSRRKRLALKDIFYWK